MKKDDGGEGDGAMKKVKSEKRHVTISDRNSTVTYDPDVPAVTYKPSRRSEVWDNKKGIVVDSSDEETTGSSSRVASGVGMSAFQVEERRRGEDRCSDRCTNSCSIM
eukprot:TRINITY_DN42430_c0_g1_i1.p1 TRINITY_DN42430_c0_g1~~TRINITY_DN42430_c0_g1_i1.p1  ORF type:complete len:107 (-),score=14.64 TRINITY_DN42430_c0_g1_i1:57-377(-)